MRSGWKCESLLLQIFKCVTLVRFPKAQINARYPYIYIRQRKGEECVRNLIRSPKGVTKPAVRESFPVFTGPIYFPAGTAQVNIHCIAEDFIEPRFGKTPSCVVIMCVVLKFERSHACYQM